MTPDRPADLPIEHRKDGPSHRPMDPPRAVLIDWRPWLDAAWDRHDTDAAALSQELASHAAHLPDDTEGAEAVRLARHVALGHLEPREGVAELRSFLARVLGRVPPATGPLADACRAASWAADAVEGREAPALPDALRWGPLADVATAEIALGRLSSARARLLDQEAFATTHAETSVRRAYAAAANNLAVALRLGPRGDAARDALMIDIAALARRAWSTAGDWMNVERADYQLAVCHAAIGQGGPALRYARDCLSRCEAEGADAYERFFAHEAMGRAHHALGNAADAAAQRARMQALLGEMGTSTDEASLGYCRQTLASMPA